MKQMKCQKENASTSCFLHGNFCLLHPMQVEFFRCILASSEKHEIFSVTFKNSCRFLLLWQMSVNTSEKKILVRMKLPVLEIKLILKATVKLKDLNRFTGHINL